MRSERRELLGVYGLVSDSVRTSSCCSEVEWTMGGRSLSLPLELAADVLSSSIFGRTFAARLGRLLAGSIGGSLSVGWGPSIWTPFLMEAPTTTPYGMSESGFSSANFKVFLDLLSLTSLNINKMARMNTTIATATTIQNPVDPTKSSAVK